MDREAFRHGRTKLVFLRRFRLELVAVLRRYGMTQSSHGTSQRIDSAFAVVDRQTGWPGPPSTVARHPGRPPIAYRMPLLQAIAPITVPALQGDTVPLLANIGALDAQTFTVTSSNPDIAASIASGIASGALASHYTDPRIPRITSPALLTYQLFQSLTPTTVSEISNLTNDGYFVNTGKYFSRIIPGFVVQGGGG